jgi:hypothetical protein
MLGRSWNAHHGVAARAAFEWKVQENLRSCLHCHARCKQSKHARIGRATQENSDVFEFKFNYRSLTYIDLLLDAAMSCVPWLLNLAMLR